MAADGPSNFDLHRCLSLYRQAVQAPLAELRLLERAYAFHNGDRAPTRLREDFAGTSAVAAAFVAADENHRALAVEIAPATAQWARTEAAKQLGPRAADLAIVEADVLNLTRPRVDVVAALNFSCFIYHSPAALRRYFRHARRCLRSAGVLVLDLFGGPGAQRVSEQRRPLAADTAGPAGTYVWQQKRFDAITHRIDCRIHFEFADGSRLADAFVYDWRLWTLPELIQLLEAAGFGAVTVWCDRYDPARGRSNGLYEPVTELPARDDWIAYLSARR